MKTTPFRRSKGTKKSSRSQQAKQTDAKLAKTRGAGKSRVSGSKSKCAADTRGDLQQIAEIPLDVLHEILWHLDPRDLLYLSWANKNWNTVVMERSARYIWKESFERLYASDNPPPRCPEDINLAKYARFLFHRTCMVCEEGVGRRVSWEMRLRVCSKCLDGPHFTRRNFRLAYECPSISNQHRTYCLAADLKNWALKSSEERKRSLVRREEGETVFLAWEKRHLEDLKDLVRLDRQTAILAKLEGLGKASQKFIEVCKLITPEGWKESEITEMYGGGFPADLAGFWLTKKKLTDADWRNIRPKILRQLKAKREQVIMQNIRRHFPKRWQKFREIFDEWTKTQTMYSFLLPHPVDIAVIEPFRSTLFESNAETAEFKLDEIGHVANEWIESRNKFIFSLLPPHLQERFGTTGFLAWEPLQRLIFHKQGCYPRLRQVCGDRDYYCKRSTLQPADQKICRMLPGGLPWNWSKEGWEFSSEYKGIFKSTRCW